MQSLARMLSGKLVIVTGGSSGIGEATCRVLTREGAKVVATGRNEESLKKLKDGGGCFDYVVGDLTKAGDCERIVNEGVAKLGGLTTLVNNAGVLKGGAMGSIDLDNFMYNFQGNTQSTFEMMQHAIPHLRDAGVSNNPSIVNGNTQTVFEMMMHAIPHLRKAGTEAGPSVVNVSSVCGVQSFGNTLSYCVSKAAVDQLTRCAAVDLAPDGIRVNAVNPGVIVTPLQKRGGMADDTYDSFLQRSIEVTHPIGKALGRVGLPEEVGELIAFLVSDKAKFITGDTVLIDGGRGCLGAR